MDALAAQVFIALAVALTVFWVARLFGGSAKGERKRLSRRLSIENRPDLPSAAGRSITMQVQVQGVPEFVARMALVQALQRRLVQAYPEQTLRRFLIVVASLAVGLFGLVFLFTRSPMAALTSGGFGAYLPFFMIGVRRNKRQKLLAVQLPDALDFLSRILRAGHSLSTGLQMMSEELPKPLGDEFRRCYGQHSLGQSIEDALKDMAIRVESTDFAFFVTAVLIQRQTGGDLSEVLRNISGMIRSRIRLQQHVKAKTAEGRFTGYILVAFPAVMFVLAYTMNPGYAGDLLYTRTGQIMLASAFGLQMLGLFAIRKITTVKV